MGPSEPPAEKPSTPSAPSAPFVPGATNKKAVFGDGDGPAEARVLCKSLSKKLTLDEIVEKFSEAGAVASIDLWRSPDSKPLGIAVVGFREVAGAEAAVKNLQGAKIKGRAFKIYMYE